MPDPRPVRSDLSPHGRDVTILALDGGGIRGLIPARVLEAIEDRTGMPACRLFDLVAGTSTGGILALALTAPKADRSGPRYSASDLVTLYRTRGPEIFRRSLWHSLASLRGFAGPKYSARPIETVLREYFGSARLGDALTPVLVTSYDTAAAKPYLFKSYREQSAEGSGSGLPDDHLLWRAARATSAAPTFFPPFALEGRSLVDGGLFANDPAMCALADAYKMFGGSRSRYLLVSIGTGNDEIRLGYGQVRGRGLLRWAIPILKMVFDGVSDAVDYQAREMADRYWRFQADGVRQELDDASPDAVRQLLAAADGLVAARRADLDELARVLRSNLAPTGPVAERRPS
ncbi:MAG TPA: CBASS cGAMP-activated phospholipase [Anaeromyxobacter sp.]